MNTVSPDARRRSLKMGPLYPITSAPNRHGWNHVDAARVFLEAGIRFFQVREKHLPDAELLRQLLEIRRLCRHFRAQFIVNDRTDLALAAGADGVHLGQNDLPVPAARKLLGPRAIVGVSTHNSHQFSEARTLPVDYIALGPIFPTPTKTGQDANLGVGIVGRMSAASPVPVVAIGGIRLVRAQDIWQAGAFSVAVISDVLNHEDPLRQIKEYLKLADLPSCEGRS